MSPRRRPPRGVSLLPLLLLLLLLLVSGPDSTAAGGTVERLMDGFDYFYKIHDYALGDPSDYDLAPITTACDCRRWCQVSARCRSVSVVKVAGGGVECRYSHRPAVLTDVTDRPRLNKTQGATHFLSAESTSWVKLGQTGVKFWQSGLIKFWDNCEAYCETLSTCSTPCKMAVINTWTLLEDAVALTSKNTDLNIGLVRRGVGTEPRWNGVWNMVSVTHSASEINTTAIPDLTPDKAKSTFSMKHDGWHVTFKGHQTSKYRCLCMENPLNLEL